MQVEEFKSIISTFSDPGTEILIDKSNILFSVNGNDIEVSATDKQGEIFIDDGTGLVSAPSWIIKRLAKLPLLASRLEEMIPSNDFFVSPSANILDSLEESSSDVPINTDNTLDKTLEILSNKNPFESKVLYITSDAGEGKTSLINEMARKQAKAFNEKKADWLLVPIPLGGRHFLRFDDITVGALQNRYRFPHLYYDSFLALVRMGVIVPAFDGFEEMFVENSSGEALSAMGMLVGTLNSKGTVVIAARKAYFEFENLKTQEKLYDSIGDFSVSFGKVELQRWTKNKFLQYCNKKGIDEPEKIYNGISERITPEHSLLTRAVLVEKLVDIASENSFESFIQKIQASGADFFSTFIHGIIEREANDKWLDRSGDVNSPLLSVDEHCELLSFVAISMWESHVDYLKIDLLEFASDYFCESKRKTSLQEQQIRERLKGHALLVPSPNLKSAIEFDHDEFRFFFLGEGLAEQLKPLTGSAEAEVLATLRKGMLPEHSQLAFIRAINRDKELNPIEIANFLFQVGMLDRQASYTQENCTSLILKLINKLDASDLNLKKLTFGINSLRDCNLKNVTFSNCYFSPSSLETTTLEGCLFQNCQFGQLRIFKSTKINKNSFNECEIESIRLVEKSLDIWNPEAIKIQLKHLGVIFPITQEDNLESNSKIQTIDEELDHINKLLRYFMRSTHIGESIIRLKLGSCSHTFIENILPELVKIGMLCEIENRGRSEQHRFKLGFTLEKINKSISIAEGSYSEFKKQVAL